MGKMVSKRSEVVPKYVQVETIVSILTRMGIMVHASTIRRLCAKGALVSRRLGPRSPWQVLWPQSLEPSGIASKSSKSSKSSNNTISD